MSTTERSATSRRREENGGGEFEACSISRSPASKTNKAMTTSLKRFVFIFRPLHITTHTVQGKHQKIWLYSKWRSTRKLGEHAEFYQRLKMQSREEFLSCLRARAAEVTPHLHIRFYGLSWKSRTTLRQKSSMVAIFASYTFCWCKNCRLFLSGFLEQAGDCCASRGQCCLQRYTLAMLNVEITSSLFSVKNFARIFTSKRPQIIYTANTPKKILALNRKSVQWS